MKTYTSRESMWALNLRDIDQLVTLVVVAAAFFAVVCWGF